jgi:FAD/FMN-containing dehydrogenase
MAKEWSNWSGSLRFTPERIETPENEEALARLVRHAADKGRTVRVVGSGHSSTPLVETDDILISLTHFKGLQSHNGREATLGAGSTLHEAGEALLEVGLSMANLGDVDLQTIAGVIGTGTHGTGKRLKILPEQLIGMRLVTGTGEIIDYAADENPEFLRAARVSLGLLGIFTSLRLRLEPAFRILRREWCTHTDHCLAHLDELVEENRNFDFYWYPRSDLTKLRTINRSEESPKNLPFARCIKEEEGWISEILPRQRELRFDEMEFWLPAAAGPECFQEVRRLVKERHRKSVCWRVLYRTVAEDDAFLSSANGRDTVTISLHQNASLPHREYFSDIEPVFRAYGGRPHWGKKHSVGAKELRPHYPQWDRFLELRKTIDPQGTFLNPYLRNLFDIG